MYGDRGFRPRGGGGFAPVNVGDELDVKIEAVGEKGDGIAKKEGFVLFVPNTKEGDEVRIRVTKVLRKVGFAEVVGEAQGTPESSEPAEEKPEEESAEEAPAEEKPEEESAEEQPAEPSAEDTEDFGEELEEKKEE
ncbi:TRAM domain-containing protein [Candidatus Woesearchaeota archaeon]|nr:TRAM domain-containing protein [Candidatus Woesearchaeota archaeon]